MNRSSSHDSRCSYRESRFIQLPLTIFLFLSLSLSPIRRSLSSKIVVSPLEERERKKERQLSHASGGDSGWILGGVAENPDCCRLSYCRDRFESRFHAALLGIIQSGRGMAAPVRGGEGFRGLKAFRKAKRDIRPAPDPLSGDSLSEWNPNLEERTVLKLDSFSFFFLFSFFPSFFSFAEIFRFPFPSSPFRCLQRELQHLASRSRNFAQR